MDFKGWKVIIVTCLLIHLSVPHTMSWSIYHLENSYILFWSVIQGLSYLLYPFYGWIALFSSSPVKIIQSSFLCMIVCSTLMIIFAIIIETVPLLYFFITSLLLGVSVITGIAGLGLYEANAIQIGMNQMIEASSDQLSDFIQWYFLCLHVGPLIIPLLSLTLEVYFEIVFLNPSLLTRTKEYGIYVLFPSCVSLLVTVAGCIILCCTAKTFSMGAVVKQSPWSLKSVFNVIKYSFKRKYPENRSAFTYWEDQIPTGINLGKQKYGGPFTNEEVDDVKVLFQLFLVIFSCFGLHLLDNGYSLINYGITTSGCPSGSIYFVIQNPTFFSNFIILVGILLYKYLKRKSYFHTVFLFKVSMLQKIQYGLFIALLSQTSCVIIGYIFTTLDTKSLTCTYNLAQNNTGYSSSCLLDCLISIKSCPQDKALESGRFFLFSLIPFILNGLSHLFVSMTTLEFICAQSPHSMKGLLIGIWYSTLSIKYFLTNVLDLYTFSDITWWNIYHGVKGFGIFVSLMAFSLVFKHYKYRQRDEIVNEQAIIEEQYERELLINSSTSDSS